jgi:hypothetical protein
MTFGRICHVTSLLWRQNLYAFCVHTFLAQGVRRCCKRKAISANLQCNS